MDYSTQPWYYGILALCSPCQAFHPCFVRLLKTIGHICFQFHVLAENHFHRHPLPVGKPAILGENF
jgi:hypothetical protein